MGLSSDQRSAGTGVEQQEEKFSWRPTSRSQELRGWTQIHLVCQLKVPDLLPIKSGSHLDRNTKPSEAQTCTARAGQPRFLRYDSAASDSLRCSCCCWGDEGGDVHRLCSVRQSAAASACWSDRAAVALSRAQHGLNTAATRNFVYLFK